MSNEINVTQSELQFLAISSLRYSLGRMTYVVAECGDFIRKHWQDFTGNTKFIILSEIKTAVEDHKKGIAKIGMQCDYDRWRDLLDWVSKQYYLEDK